MKQTITITREISDIAIPGAAALQFYMARMVEVENQNLIKMQQEHPELFNPVPVPEPPVS